jgi:uncharacterized protein
LFLSIPRGQILRGTKVVEKNFDFSFNYLLGASVNNAEANFILATLYLNGESPVEKNSHKALDFFLRSEELGNTEALLQIALIYKDFGNFEKALFYSKKSSNLGNTEAFFISGIISLEFLTEEHEIEAIIFFKKAIEKKHVKAMLSLGWLYYKANFIKRDLNEAMKYLNMASENNDVLSFYFLGEIFLEKNEITKALEYFEKAADLEEINSILKLGKIHFDGEFVEKNLEKSQKYFEKASSRDNLESFYFLGEIFLEQNELLKSKEIFEIASNKGHLGSTFRLALFYYEEEMNSNKLINAPKSIELFEKCAEKEHFLSLVLLGSIYQDGILVTKNLEKSLQFFEKANSKESFYSSHILGEIHEKTNLEKSKEYFKIAADLGNNSSMFKLGEILYKEEFERIENKEILSIPYLEKSAKLGNQDSLFLLGHIYYEGKIIDKNSSKALEYFDLASKKDISEAFYMMGLIFLDKATFDITKSIENLKKASERGVFNASLKLYDIYIEGTLIERDFLVAISFLEKVVPISEQSEIFTIQIASICYDEFLKTKQKEILEKSLFFFSKLAHNGNIQSMLFLGHLYFEQNQIEEAISYFEMASKNASDDAYFMLGLIHYGKDPKLSKSLFKKSSNLFQSNLMLAQIYLPKNHLKSLYYYRQYLLGYNLFLKNKSEKKTKKNQTFKGKKKIFIFYLHNFIFIIHSIQKKKRKKWD